MSQVGSVWITDQDAGLCVLSMKSSDITEHRRVNVTSTVFEKRGFHVVTVGLLSDEDLLKIRAAINQHLGLGD